jgi:hypothetical protein
MIYTQYREASLKHLQACKTALHGLRFYRGNSGVISSTPSHNRDALLLDIFYLSGYTLECIINYAIYKRIGWITNPVDSMQNSQHRISFYKNQSGVSFRPSYWIAQHKFNRNVQLLHLLLPGNNVPLINRAIPVSINLQRMVFDAVGTTRNNDHWKPELRYEPTNWFSTRYTEQDIIDLVSLTETVYNDLLRIA